MEPPIDRSRRGLHRDFWGELRWTFSHRRGWLIGFVVNLLIAAIFVGYTHYDARRSALRVAGLAAELAAWVIAGTLATNQLGDDLDAVLASHERHGSIVRVLVVKNLVLGALLLMIAVAVSVVVQIDFTKLHELFSSVTEDLLDVFVVLLWLGVGSLASVLLPYRPLPLRARWRARETWLRWGLCVTLPYLLYFLVMPNLIWPPHDVARHLFGGRHANLVEYSSTFVLWGLFIWGAGLALSALYARLAPERLAADLRRQS